jgi:DNA-binding NarL/FixJ family response regulator
LPPIHVALIDLSPILTRIVSQVLAKPDIRAEGSFSGEEGYEQVARLRPEVVIVGLDDDTPGEDGLPPKCQRLLSSHPWAKVLSVAHDGRDAVLHELRPRRTVLGEASPENLLETIRSVRARPT